MLVVVCHPPRPAAMRLPWPHTPAFSNPCTAPLKQCNQPPAVRLTGRIGAGRAKAGVAAASCRCLRRRRRRQKRRRCACWPKFDAMCAPCFLAFLISSSNLQCPSREQSELVLALGVRARALLLHPRGVFAAAGPLGKASVQMPVPACRMRSNHASALAVVMKETVSHFCSEGGACTRRLW